MCGIDRFRNVCILQSVSQHRIQRWNDPQQDDIRSHTPDNIFIQPGSIADFRIFNVCGMVHFVLCHWLSAAEDIFPQFGHDPVLHPGITCPCCGLRCHLHNDRNGLPEKSNRIPETIPAHGDYVVGRTLHVANGSIRLPNAVISSLRSSLISVTLPDTLTKIQENAFRGCSSLASVSIPDSVITIGNYAFKDCSALSELVLPDSIEALSNGMCSGCSQLVSVTIPDAITHIPTEAFADCGKLEKVNLKRDNPTFRGNSFRNCYSLYDSRFNIIDRRNINFTATSNSAAQNDIVNLTLDYAINSELTQSDEYTIALNLPDNVETAAETYISWTEFQNF